MNAKKPKQPFHAALRKYAFDGDTLRDLRTLDTRATPGFTKKKGKTKGKEAGQHKMLQDVELLSHEQELLFSNAQTAGLRRSVLLIMQGMDTAGKGGAIKHVVGAMNPQGVHQVGFKAPTPEELQHDFLWRIRKHTPKHGYIGIFDRSHYEDVLIHRVEELTPPSRIARRYGSIRQFEKDMVNNGTLVIKVMLHISKEEQYQRLSARLDDPTKHWKFTESDLDARSKWDQYMQAHQVAIEETHKPEAPWFVIPADRKWYARLAVQQLLLESIASLDLSWPVPNVDINGLRKRLEKLR